MPLDNNAIETLSINAVKNSIVMCEYLSQFINDNDKEPSWDGAVYIYGEKSKTKDKLKGRMPVQIKGTECDDFSQEEISFQMSTIDLRNYLYDGGCILFVVYIGNNGLTNKIYYSELTPIKLRQLLTEAKEQDSKVVHLTPFPFDNNRKATIFLNCLQNCQKQASFKEGKLLSLKELEEQGLLENIVIPFSGVGIKDPQIALVSNEVYMYAKIKGSSIPQPLNMIPKDIHTYQTVDALISIDSIPFYANYSIIKSADKTVLRIGESLTMEFTDSDHPCKIKYKNSDKIRILAKDLDFMLTYLDKGSYQVNGVNFPFDYSGANFSNFDTEKEKEHLTYIKKIVSVLDLLNCSDDIDINDMEEEDWRNLNRLIEAFIDKKPVSGLKDNLPPVCCMKVGKLRFALYLKKCSGEDAGKYEIFDFFKTELSVAVDDADGNKLPISQFCILHTNDFLTLSNINYDVLLPSYQNAAHHAETFNRANWFLLDLLSACDKLTGKRKDRILKVCEDFSEWIVTAPETELDYQVKVLNQLQVIKRRRDFTIDEISCLYKLVENPDTREDCRVGAYLLLGQQHAASLHFAKLSEDEQKNFIAYPIYFFWKESCAENCNKN